MVSEKTIKKMVDNIDLLIVKEVDLPRHQRGKYVRKFLTGFRFPKDILIYTPEEINEWKDCPLAFITTVVNKGKILYEQDRSR